MAQVGFFSAIVATFLVGSLDSLGGGGTTRTNELLLNLTGIIISQAGNAIPPTPFVPDPADVRVNVYWSMSLVLTVSTYGGQFTY